MKHSCSSKTNRSMGTGSIFSTSHHYLFRDLNYHTGRWLTCDPIGEQGGWNLYAFCGNDGVSKWDRLGTRCCTAKEIIECMKALGRVWKKLLFVEDDIRRYSPTKDYYGGFLTHGGKITSPCGHYKEINEGPSGIFVGKKLYS